MSAPYLVEPDAMLVLDDELAQPDFDALLEEPASAVETKLPDYDPRDEDPSYVAEAREPGWLKRILLEEGITSYIAKKFDESKHPRWPKGTPKAGKFMRVGDVFKTKDGREWQVIHASGRGMKVVATDYSGKTADHIELKAESSAHDGKGVAVPGISAPSGKTFDKNTSPVVSPYVEPDTHDPSLKLPAESKLSEEEWKRFGRIDQEYYLDLMERFGSWKASEAQSMMNAAYNQYDHSTKAAIDGAYKGNKGGTGFWSSGTWSGAGQWLNLAYLFKNGKKFDEYEKIKANFDELTEVVHWDLMNRCKAPDITLFHGGGGDGQGVVKYQNDYVGGKIPIYAGFSQSYSLSGAESWGSTILATPTAIRHVAMSYYTKNPGGASNWGELELAVGVRMKLDGRSVAFSSSDYGMAGMSAKQAVSTWLHGETAKQPRSGALIDDLKDVWQGKGPIPIPEEALNLIPIASGGQAFEELPSDVAAQAGKMAWDAPYKSDDGSKEAAIGILGGMGLKPGDFVEGKQGTRYVIIADAQDPNGLRYVKIDPASKLPNYTKSYPLQSSQANEFYRLDGHIDIPKVKQAGFAQFTDEQYAKLVPGELKPLADFKPGDMFKAEGEGYKVTGPGPGGKVYVESLDTGKKYTAAALHKEAILVKSEGFVEPVMVEDPEEALKPSYKVGDAVIVGGLLSYITELPNADGNYHVSNEAMSDMEVLAASIDPGPTLPGIVGDSPLNTAKLLEKGDKFAFEGKTYTVTNVLKGGEVRARVAGGAVRKFSPEHLHHNTIIWRPSTFAIGDPAKVSDLAIGDVVQGGTGEKIRPYMVEGKLGSKYYLRNLETLALVKVTGQKQYRRLLDAKTIKAQVGPGPGEKPVNPENALGLVPTGAERDFDQLEAGDIFSDLNGGHFVVTDPPNAEAQKIGFKALHVGADGKVADKEKLFTASFVKKQKQDGWKAKLLDVPSPAQIKAKPELGSKFDPEKYVTGDDVKLKDLEPGALFLSSTGLAMQLKSNKPAGGATAVALHNGKTVKNISYEKSYKSLVEKDEAPFDWTKLKMGDQVITGNLHPNDTFWSADMAEAAGAKSGSFIVTEVHDGSVKVAPMGEDGQPTQAGMTVGSHIQVTYAGQGGGPPKFGKTQTPLDAGDYDQAPYESYLHPKSGKYKYPKLSQMPPGTVFTDKSGKAWKLKQGGDQIVISDGTNLYAADSSWRGKVDEDGTVAFIENTDLPDPADHDGVTVGNLKKGDSFIVGAGYHQAGKKYTVTDTSQVLEKGSKSGSGDPKTDDYYTISVEDEDGKKSQFAAAHKPAQVFPYEDPMLGGSTENDSEFVKHLKAGDKVTYTTPDGGKFQGIVVDPLPPHSNKVKITLPTGVATDDTPIFVEPDTLTDPAHDPVPLANNPRQAWISDNFQVLDQTVTKKLMPAFSFAQTKDGTIVYKGVKGDLFALGVKDVYEGDTKGMKQVKWAGHHPELEDIQFVGPMKPLKEVTPGEMFHVDGKGDYIALAVGKDGITGQKIGAHPPLIGFAAYDYGVNMVAPLGYKGAPPDDPNDHYQIPTLADVAHMPVGAKFWYENAEYSVVGTDEHTATVTNPAGQVLEIDFSDIPPGYDEPQMEPVEDTTEAPGQYAYTLEKGDTFTLPGDESNNYEITKSSGGKTTEWSQAKNLGTGELWDMPPGTFVHKSITPASKHVTHVKNLEPGDTYDVPAIGLTWQVQSVENPGTSGARATVKLTANTSENLNIPVGTTDVIDGPINVNVTKTPIEADAEKTVFEAGKFGKIPNGTHFTSATPPNFKEASSKEPTPHAADVVYLKIGAGTQSGWAKAPNGATVNFDVKTPVQYITDPSLAGSGVKTEVKASSLKPGDVFVQDPNDDPTTLGWKVDPSSSSPAHLEATGIGSSSSLSMPLASSKSLWKVEPAEPSAPVQFTKGDKVSVFDGHEGVPATVIEKVASGNGYYVSNDSGVVWVADPQDIAPAGGTADVDAKVAPFEVYAGTLLANKAGDILEKQPNGDLLMVTKMLGSKSSFKEGETFTSNEMPVFTVVPPHGLKKGMKFKAEMGHGPVYEVTNVASDGAVTVALPGKQGTTFNGNKIPGILKKRVWVLEPNQSLEPPSKVDPDPLVPYLHPKSGKYKYVQLVTLPAGTKFTDKTGAKYKVKGHLGNMTQFEDASGFTYAAPSTHRVKSLGIEEARVAERIVLDGGGRILVGA